MMLSERFFVTHALTNIVICINNVDNMEYAIQKHLAITGEQIDIEISNKTLAH